MNKSNATKGKPAAKPARAKSVEELTDDERTLWACRVLARFWVAADGCLAFGKLPDAPRRAMEMAKESAANAIVNAVGGRD